jgi:type IV pilus assembly protein PilQ
MTTLRSHLKLKVAGILFPIAWILCSVAQAAGMAAANVLESLDVAPQQGGKIVVKVGLKRAPVGVPTGFLILNPPRVALDLPDTSNALGKTSQQVGDGDLRSINIVQAGERTRLVMNLNRAMSFDSRVEGDAILLTLTPKANEVSSANAAVRFAEASPTQPKHSIRDIDFRRGKGGEGQIVIDLSDSAPAIDLRVQGKSIVIDLADTALPKNLEKRLDVKDFATPVQTVTTTSQGGSTRMVVEPKGIWEHSAYQTDNRFILEVRQVVEDPNKLVQGSRQGYSGEKLSLNFQNVDVRAVLQVIADFTGLNIITSDTVAGNLTLRLKDVPWDQALDIILQAKGLDMRKNGNVVWIAPRDELATKEKLALESQQQIADLEPLRTESFQLNYQKGDNVIKILTDDKQKILSRRGSAVQDPRTNTVFVQDTAARLEEIRKLIAKIDIPVRQVMIEARIVEAIDTFARNLGVKLGYNDLTGRGNQLGGGPTRGMVGGQLAATGYTTGQISTPVPTLDQSLSVNLPATAIAGFNPAAFSLLLFNSAGTKFLNLELSALQADSKGKIISSPRVVTADQVEASIEQGTEIPYQQATASGATSVQFKKATLSLKVKPQITPDDNVIMTVDVHKDRVGQDTRSGPSIDTKQVTTQVLVENGGTVVIGGIYEQEERSETRKVPALGDVPVIGFLFKQNQRKDDKTELLVFISPKIIKDNLATR